MNRFVFLAMALLLVVILAVSCGRTLTTPTPTQVRPNLTPPRPMLITPSGEESTQVLKNCNILPNYIGNYPNDAEPGWSDNLQGVANDNQNWYFTQEERLLKSPVWWDLNSSLEDPDNPPAAIISKRMPSPLKDAGYDHFGDLDYWGGYLFVPLEKKGAQLTPAIGVFRASDLEYIGFYLYTCSGAQASWCAVMDVNGIPYLYTSAEDLDGYEQITRYNLYPISLDQSTPRVLSECDRFYLYTESSNKTKFRVVQGGDFADSGCLYLVVGYYVMTPEELQNSGIMIFDTTTWTRIAKSANDSGTGGFKFQYSPNFPHYQEPEGITIWDLGLDPNNSPAPGIAGQIHVIMIVNDSPSVDDLYFKHYKVIGW